MQMRARLTGGDSGVSGLDSIVSGFDLGFIASPVVEAPSYRSDTVSDFA